jgi:uncharacterized protein RhaS with RHS repeats
LHYNYFRYYDPKLGRYLRADPIGLEGGINPYAYVQNNPVNWGDPYGLMTIDLPGHSKPWGDTLGPPIGGPAAGIGLGAIIGAIWNAATDDDDCKRKRCRPCVPPVGTIGYKIHPAGTHRRGSHKDMDHVQTYKMNQVPVGTPPPGEECRCFWQFIGHLENTLIPPSGAVPMVPAGGGGVEYY